MQAIPGPLPGSSQPVHEAMTAHICNISNLKAGAACSESAGSLLLSETLDLVRAGCRKTKHTKPVRCGQLYMPDKLGSLFEYNFSDPGPGAPLAVWQVPLIALNFCY